MANFTISTRIFFGRNATDEAQRFIEKLRIRNLALIVDNNIRDLKVFRELISAFEDKGHFVESIKGFDASAEPTYDMLDDFTESFRGTKIDAIIGVGGGSVLDIAKGVGILLTNPGKAIDYRGMDKVRKSGVPVICYPTTGGTGAEVTHTASFVDTKTKTKLGINGRYVSPLCGVLAPELTFSCAEKTTVSAGLDAMLHAIEAVSARTANLVTSMLGTSAFSVLYTNLKKVVAEPDNYDAREGMLLGSYYAGIAMMNAGGGPASAISYPLGVHYDVPHGIAGGIFLPHVFEYNISKGYKGYNQVYNNFPDADLKLNDNEKSLDFLAKFKQFYNDIGAPESLTKYGGKNIDVDFLTELTMEQRKANLDLNPEPFGRNEVKEILSRVI